MEYPFGERPSRATIFIDTEMIEKSERNIMIWKTKQELAQYFHLSAFCPVKSTFIKSTNHWNLHSWYRISAELISKHLPTSQFMFKGWLYQEKKTYIPQNHWWNQISIKNPTTTRTANKWNIGVHRTTRQKNSNIVSSSSSSSSGLASVTPEHVQ